MMNKVLYAKTVASRKEKFRILTSIEERSGRRLVFKKALSPESRRHLGGILKNEEKWQNFIAETGKVLRGKLVESGSGIQYSFISDYNLEKNISDFLLEKDFAKASEHFSLGLRIIEGLPCFRLDALAQFTNLKQYREVFLANPVLPSYFIKTANLDIVADNLIISKDKPLFIDCEWIFDFPIERDFVKYRYLFYLANKIGPLLRKFSGKRMVNFVEPGLLIFEEWWSMAFNDLNRKLLINFQRKEENFQRYVYDYSDPNIRTNFSYEKVIYEGADLFSHLKGLTRVNIEKDLSIEAFGKQKSVLEKEKDILDREVRKLKMDTEELNLIADELEAAKRKIVALDAAVKRRDLQLQRLRENHSRREVQLINSKEELKILKNQLDNIISAKTFRAWQKFNVLKRMMLEPFVKKRRSPVAIPGDDPVREMVSVIIPTLNAGDDFFKVLLFLKKQRGVKRTEIIVIDSGSTDRTTAIARQFGCRVIKIKPSEFGHGKTRNLGASLAKGDYFLFTVQDAIPEMDNLLNKIINFMKVNSLAAASPIQRPRSGASPFSQWQMHNHYDFINPEGGDQIIDGKEIDPQGLGFFEKRKNCLIDDVFSIYNKKEFSKIKFSNEIEFAEDALMSMKLLANKKRIGLLASAWVSHSHERDATYHFKRAFVESLALEKILGKNPNIGETTEEEILALTMIIPSLSRWLKRWVVRSNRVDLRGLIDLRLDDLKEEKRETRWSSFLHPVRNAFERTSCEEADIRRVLSSIKTVLRYVSTSFFNFIGEKRIKLSREERLVFVENALGLAGGSLLAQFFMGNKDKNNDKKMAIVADYLGAKV